MIKSSKSKIKHRFLPTLILITTFCLFPGNRSDAIESEKSEVIGFYTSGCIANSLPLPEAGTGYQVIRLSRKRFYGHPNLIQYIKSLGRSVASYLTGTLLIGDLSQEKGGPLPDEHSSHQNGLDADILFWQNPIAATRILTWRGHDGHFHVRLSCPYDSPLCKPQKPVPDGDGCDTGLDNWLKAIARIQKKDDKPRPKARTPLPKECLTLLPGY